MSRAYGFAAYGGPETQQWFDREPPTPGPSELLIAVRAAGVNPVDHKIRDGAMADPAATPAFPMVLGVEGAGVVVAVGGDVVAFSVGDEVLGKAAPQHGTYAEHAVLRASDAMVKPPGLSWVQAAALPVAAGTAADVLAALMLTAGETLLINGAGGGVGILAAQLARDAGAAVVGTGSESKRALVESVGATHVAYDTGDVVAQVRRLLSDGVDAVFDLVGGQALADVAGLVGDPGRVVSVADPAVAELGGQFLVSGCDRVAQVVDLVVDGKVDPKVLQTYPFDEAEQALSAVESGHVLGKIVIDLEQSTRS